MADSQSFEFKLEVELKLEKGSQKKNDSSINIIRQGEGQLQHMSHVHN
jgi:hypothetical protein